MTAFLGGAAADPTHPGIPNDQMPGLFRLADQDSLAAQRRYVRAVRSELILAVVVAVAGTLDWEYHGLVPAAVVSAAALLSIGVIELYLYVAKPDRAWYDGRVVAESVKTLAWRYAIGATPYEVTHEQGEVDDRFIHELGKIAPDVRFAPSKRAEALLAGDGRGHPHPLTGAITDRMRQLRSWPLEHRRDQYLRGRIHDQCAFYTSRGSEFHRRATLFQVLMILGAFVAAGGAVLRALDQVPFDLAGVGAVVVASLAAWLGVRQYSTLAAAYAVAATDLGNAEEKIQAVADEHDWARVCLDAEQSISREHTSWRASRSQVGLR